MGLSRKNERVSYRCKFKFICDCDGWSWYDVAGGTGMSGLCTVAMTEAESESASVVGSTSEEGEST